MGGAETQTVAPLPVIVCSTTQIADFTRQVVGDRCKVLSILAPGADPHTYMPTPNDAKMVLSADLALEPGLVITHIDAINARIQLMQRIARHEAGLPGWATDRASIVLGRLSQPSS